MKHFYTIAVLFFLSTLITAQEKINPDRLPFTGSRTHQENIPFFKKKLRVGNETQRPQMVRGEVKSALETKQQLDSLVVQTNETGGYENNWKDDYSYNAAGNMTGYIYSEWDTQNNGWIGIYKIEQDFSDGRLTEYRDFWIEEESSTWVPYDRQLYTYDSNGRTTTFEDLQWDSGSQKWMEIWKQEYTYTTKGQQSVIVVYLWDEDLSDWVANSKVELTYENDLMTLRTEYVFDADGNVWTPQSKSEYTLNAGGKITYSVDSDWEESSTGWIQASKSEYSLDSKGNTILILDSEWDQTGDAWNPTLKSEYDYDSNNNPVSEIYYDPDPNTDWAALLKIVYDYSKNIYSELVAPQPEWLLPDFFNQVISQPSGFTFYSPATGSSGWAESSIGTYFYSDRNLTAVNTVENQGVKVFPNPMQNNLQVSLPGSQKASFKIFDIAGRTRVGTEVSNNIRIDVSSLPAGMYFYQLSLEGQVHSGKLIKK